MSMYFYDLHQCGAEVLRDRVGREAPDSSGARDAAIEMARAFMANEVAQGRLCLSCWIVVTDASGHYLMTVQFGEAIVLRGSDCHAADDEAAASTGDFEHSRIAR